MKKRMVTYVTLFVFCLLATLTIYSLTHPSVRAKISPITGGTDITFVKHYDEGIFLAVALLLLLGIEIVEKKYYWNIGNLILLQLGYIICLLTIFLCTGCPDTGTPYARISTGLQIMYWRDPQSPVPDYKDWMMDDWKITETVTDPNENLITRMKEGRFDFHIYLKGQDGEILRESGTKYAVEVVAHYDMMNNWESDGRQDKWPALGRFISNAADNTGDSVVSVWLGDDESYWVDYTATFVDLKVTCPMAPWTPVYLRCAFVDQYPGDEISLYDTIYTSLQDVSNHPMRSDLDMDMAAAVSFDPHNIYWDGSPVIQMESSGYHIEPNSYSSDPNVSYYCNRWCRMEGGSLVEISCVYPAYPYLPIPTPDPNTDPNDFPYWDPNSPLYKYVDPQGIDPSYMENYNPIYCTFKYGIPDGMSLPYIHPFTRSTAYLRSVTEEGHIKTQLPINIYLVYADYDENWVIGITQPIVPCLCWMYNDYWWTAGYFSNRVFMSIEERGRLEVVMPSVYGDLTADRQIDFEDLILFSNCWLGNASVPDGGYELAADSNLDGIINYEDFVDFVKAMQ